jgi:hypothetical protein
MSKSVEQALEEYAAAHPYDAKVEITDRLGDYLEPFQKAIQAIQNELYSAACLATDDTKQNLMLAYYSLRLGWYALERDEADKVRECLARVKREAAWLVELPNG